MPRLRPLRSPCRQVRGFPCEGDSDACHISCHQARAVGELPARGRGHRLPRAQRSRHAGSLRQCVGLRWWPAVGGDAAGIHAEISAAVVGMNDAQARALGRRFGQDAVFAWSPASWRLLGCADAFHDTVATGWHAALLGRDVGEPSVVGSASLYVAATEEVRPINAVTGRGSLFHMA
ncbi:DUF3293 domain-containing protein [Streptomyces sp. NPDC007251]|uniref:DUF3293 domain-containing protein n=1 Tax=Streptomyces sp. NPDC007251 TaxID=3154483 RepID=UPI0033FB0B74